MERARRRHDPNLQEQGGAFTWKQTQLIRGHNLMGISLAHDLAQDPELRDELSRLIHDTPLDYEGVLRYIFFESGRDAGTLVISPFVRAFEATPQCTDEERALLSRLKNVATRTDAAVPEGLTSDFQEWADARMPFLAKGLQRYVLDSGLIDPLTREEANKKAKEGYKAWIKANPEIWAENQRRASAAAAESAQPRVFTDKLRAQIQKWFDKGWGYETVVEALKGRGIIITKKGLIRIVAYYEDLHFTPYELKRREREGFLEAVKDIFKATGSRRETIVILQKLGHHPKKTEAALNKYRLRERIDWRNTVDVAGEQKRLRDIVADFVVGGYPTIKDEYNAFMSFIKDKGVNVKISVEKYRDIRKRILHPSESQK